MPGSRCYKADADYVELHLYHKRLWQIDKSGILAKRIRQCVASFRYREVFGCSLYAVIHVALGGRFLAFFRGGFSAIPANLA